MKPASVWVDTKRACLLFARGHARRPPHNAGRGSRLVPLLVATAFYSLAVGSIMYGVSIAAPNSLYDLGAFLASGRSAAQGLNPYVVDPSIGASLGGVDPVFPNLNAPLSVLLFQSFAWVDPRIAARVWLVFSTACYCIAVGLLCRAYRPRVVWRHHMTLAVGLAGFWITLFLGQLYNVLLLLIVLSWLCLRSNRYVWGGLLIGFLVAFKPQLAVWPALLLLAGHRRTPLVAGVGGASLALLPAALYGPTVYAQWVAAVTGREQDYGLADNVSLLGLTIRLGLPGLGLVLSALLLASLALWVWRRRPDALGVSAVALPAILLSSPVGWVGCLVWLLPVFFHHRWTGLLWFAALILVVPQIYWMHEALLGLPYTVGTLAALVGTLRDVTPEA